MIQMYAPQNNSPHTVLTEGISASTTTITIDDASILPSAPNVLTIGVDDGAELVLMTAKSSNILTVTRAFNGTTAQAWDKGAMIYRAITAQDIEALQKNVSEVDAKVNPAKEAAVAEAVATAAADATSKANAAKTEAIATAASDATAKANNAKTAAVEEANDYADSVAATAKSEAISTAATDATSKANAAKASAIETASGDAATKANAAQSNAVASANAYTDSKVATAKADAISTAAGDATTKMNSAISTAAADATAKANEAKNASVPRSGGISMTGPLVAHGGAYGTAQMRNMYFGTAEKTEGEASSDPEGTVYFSFK